MRGRREGLPSTAYAVLGLLSLGRELSGYDLWQWAQNLRFFYWSPAHSQIYAELRRLEERGLVTSRKVVQEHRPDKRLYRITDAGLEAARRFMNEAPVEPTVMKHAVALRLFFGHLARPERLQELLDEYAATLQTTLAELDAVRESLRGSDEFRFPMLVAEWGLAYYRAEIDAARAAARRVAPRGRQPEAGPGS